MASTYNYPRFDEHVELGEDQVAFGAFGGNLHVGRPAPSFGVTPLDGGDRFDISDLWRQRDVVMEFGSFT